MSDRGASAAVLHGVARQIVLVLAAVAMVAVNMLGGGGGFSGSGSNDVYSSFPTAFTPAVYTFAVWAPIFIGALAFAVYQALPSRRSDTRIDAVALPLVIAYLLNTATVYTRLGLSDIVTLMLLATLAWAFVIVAHLGRQDRRFFWFVRAPLAVFFGWITAATILNVFQWLSSKGISGFGPHGQQRLKAARVLVSRAGGVGGAAATYLAAAGIGRLVIAHAGPLRLDDLNRQTLMSTAGIGRSRVE
ncbi:MAG: ThiF family adenylyltransferase, partial [Actinomycetes bacterium]